MTMRNDVTNHCLLEIAKREAANVGGDPHAAQVYREISDLCAGRAVPAGRSDLELNF